MRSACIETKVSRAVIRPSVVGSGDPIVGDLASKPAGGAFGALLAGGDLFGGCMTCGDAAANVLAALTSNGAGAGPGSPGGGPGGSGGANIGGRSSGGPGCNDGAATHDGLSCRDSISATTQATLSANIAAACSSS